MNNIKSIGRIVLLSFTAFAMTAVSVGCAGTEFTNEERDEWVKWCWTYTEAPNCGELGDSMKRVINEKKWDEDCTVKDMTALVRSRSGVSAGGRQYLEECEPPDPCIEIEEKWKESLDSIPPWTEEIIASNLPDEGSTKYVDYYVEYVKSEAASISVEKMDRVLLLADRILELDKVLADAWVEVQAYSSNSDPESANPALSAGMSQEEWDSLMDSEQRIWTWDWRAKFRINRALGVAGMEHQVSNLKGELAELADDPDAALLWNSESEFWAEEVSHWEDLADDYGDAVHDMDREDCWPIPRSSSITQ